MEISVSDLVPLVPKNMKNNVNQQFVDTLNKIASDDEFREQYRQNLISHTSVLSQGTWTLQQYVDAVRYISYKHMGDTNIKAYIRTFPDKYMHFKSQGVEDKTISRYVSAYNKSKLVNLVWEQSSIPFHVYNMDYRQKALMVQVDLMMNANSEKVKTDAANSVLTHTKPPETSKVEIDVTHKEGGFISDLRQATEKLVQNQSKSIESGSNTAQSLAGEALITNAEYHEVE